MSDAGNQRVGASRSGTAGFNPSTGVGVPWRLEVHAELDSTSDELIRLAMSLDFDPDGREGDCLAVMALRQTKGRGQFGRVWHAPEGNLNLSLMLRPTTALRDAPQWSLAAGVAAAEALRDLVPDLRLKYPNDLMVNGCKLGGILVESTAVEGELGWLIIGIGINVAAAPDLPEQRTIALAERGVVITPEKLAWELLFRIGAWRAIIENQGFAPVRAAWRLLAVDPDRAETHLRQWERD